MTVTVSSMNVVEFVPPVCATHATAAHPADIVITRVPIPALAPHEVLIRVAAAGVNAADLNQRAGHYPPQRGGSEIPGLEVSGTIESVGAAVSDWEPGSSVCALLAGGGYSEYVAVDARHVLPVPESVSLIEAGGLVEVAATCWANLFMQARTQAGEWVLVHGGTGGLGQFAVQLLNAVGARPIVTAGSDEKAALAHDLGAHHAIRYRDEDFVERVQGITEGHGADVILDVVGGAYLERNIRALAKYGRVVTVGIQGGATGTLPFMLLMAKRGWLTGTFLRSRDADEKAEVIRQVREHVWPLIEDGRISTGVDEVFGLAETNAALDRFSDPARTGKIVLTPAR